METISFEKLSTNDYGGKYMSNSKLAKSIDLLGNSKRQKRVDKK